MMFSRERKMVFFMPPKTGTTTLSTKLYELGFIGPSYIDEENPTPRHLTYEFAIKCYPELVDYKMYGFFRNPEERLASVLNSCSEDMENIQVSFSKIFCDNLICFQPQIVFLKQPEVKVLDFDNFDAELINIFGSEAIKPPLLKLNSKPKLTDVTAIFKKYAQTVYKEDYELGEKALGKRYQ
jgi:hypothetical protein